MHIYLLMPGVMARKGCNSTKTLLSLRVWSELSKPLLCSQVQGQSRDYRCLPRGSVPTPGEGLSRTIIPAPGSTNTQSSAPWEGEEPKVGPVVFASRQGMYQPLKEQSLERTAACLQESPKAGGIKRTQGDFSALPCRGCPPLSTALSCRLAAPDLHPGQSLLEIFLGQRKETRAMTCPFCARDGEIVPFCSCALQSLSLTSFSTTNHL